MGISKMPTLHYVLTLVSKSSTSVYKDVTIYQSSITCISCFNDVCVGLVIFQYF